MRNICYTCFDGDNDIHYYYLMTAWHVNSSFEFTFENAHTITQSRDTSTEETIKRSLRTRLNSSDVFLVLVGKNTKSLYKYVLWEIEVALELKLPIIVVNLNDKRSFDSKLCPPILTNKLTIHISFGPKIISHAIKEWPISHKIHNQEGEISPYYYPEEVYNKLGQ